MLRPTNWRSQEPSLKTEVIGDSEAEPRLWNNLPPETCTITLAFVKTIQTYSFRLTLNTQWYTFDWFHFPYVSFTIVLEWSVVTGFIYKCWMTDWMTHCLLKPPHMVDICGDLYFKAVLLNWWVGVQKWAAELFYVGHESFPGNISFNMYLLKLYNYCELLGCFLSCFSFLSLFHAPTIWAGNTPN